jgi:cyclopropane-fatty-acyl-phospholipid synthase
MVLSRLAGLPSDSLRLHEDGHALRLGNGSRDEVSVRIEDPQLWPALALGGSLGGAEAWMEGWWTSQDLPALIRLLARNRSTLEGLNGGLARLASPARRWMHRGRANSRSGSRRNIAAHYDLGNDFFRSFLDRSMTYSSAWFENHSQSLEAAQEAKYERLCSRLCLNSNHRLLEIGTGWGGFAIHAARTRGCRVTTTTISVEQHSLAAERIREAGLSDRVELLLRDYRDLQGDYDRLVSIEMIEAVGYENYEAYFRTCSERLKPDGSMAIQAILHRDQDFDTSLRRVDFIKKYIFPGGQLPSIGALTTAMTESTDLRLTGLEDMTAHYAETLRRWRAQLHRRWTELRDCGHSERFLRMWDFYFAYCEGGFDERYIGVAQLVFEKPGSRLSSISEV